MRKSTTSAFKCNWHQDLEIIAVSSGNARGLTEGSVPSVGHYSHY